MRGLVLKSPVIKVELNRIYYLVNSPQLTKEVTSIVFVYIQKFESTEAQVIFHLRTSVKIETQSKTKKSKIRRKIERY